MPIKLATRAQFSDGPKLSSCRLSGIPESVRMVKRQTPELNKLLKRVRRLTKADGSKPKLADRLGFHVGLIYDWLAGRNEPGGEVTLQMLKWAEAEEGKPKKDAGRVTSTPAKARKIANQTNEKPTPKPREK